MLRHELSEIPVGSQLGAEVTIYLQIKRLYARWSKKQWWAVSCSLSLDFRNLNPKDTIPYLPQ